jgi:hypothetical protein
MTRPRRFLDVVRDSDGLSLIVHKTSGVFLVGSRDDAPDHYCGNCRAQPLMERIADGEVWNLAFRCPACGAVCTTQSMPPGSSWPAGRTVFVPTGMFYQDAPISTLPGWVLIGQAAADLYRRETGQDGTLARLTTEPGPGREANAAFIEGLIDRARALFGESFEPLLESDRRGQASPTPPRHRHRAAFLISLLAGYLVARARGEPPRQAPPATDPLLAAAELDMSLSILERWSKNPVWPTIHPSLKSPTDYVHSIILLAAASWMVDVGNGANLVVETGIRLHDVAISLSASERLRLEVKAPVALQDAPRPLTGQEAYDIMKSARRKAGTGPGGQLGGSGQAILVVGGMRLRASDVSLLKGTVPRVLNERPISSVP